MTRKRSLSFRALPWMLLVVLGLVVIQGALVWKDYARPWLGTIHRFGAISSFQRGEIIYIGFNEAKYVRFLDAYIPRDSPVVLPDQKNARFTSQNVMQFYLFPRPIWDCADITTVSCLEYAHDPASFLLSMGDFPPPQLVDGKVFIPFPEPYNGLNGVYAPADLAGHLAVPIQAAYDRLSVIPIGAPFIEAGVLGLLFFLGFVFISLLFSRATWMDLLGLSIPMAMGVLTWTIFITSFIGIPITWVTVALWYILLGLMGLGALRIFKRSLGMSAIQDAGRSIRSVWRQDRIALLLAVAFGVWFGLACLISVGRSYTVFDDIANWYLKGYAMVAEHTIWAGEAWGGHILAYPMNLQLSTALFQLADGDQLPGSKTLFPILAFALLSGCYQFLRRRHVDRKVALAAILLIFTVPLFFQHATTGMANLPMTAYLVLGVLWTFEGFWKKSIECVAVGGVFLAFAAWTRPEGIGFSLVMLLGIFAVAILGMRIKWSWKYLLAAVLPILIFPGSWLVLLGWKQMKRDQVGNDLAGFFASGLHFPPMLEAIKQIGSYGLKYFSTWSSAGFLVPACLVLWVLMLMMNYRKNLRGFILLTIVTSLAWLFPLGMFFVASFTETRFMAFLDQSFDRAFLPAMVLLAVCTFIPFGNPQGRIATEKG